MQHLIALHCYFFFRKMKSSLLLCLTAKGESSPCPPRASDYLSAMARASFGNPTSFFNAKLLAHLDSVDLAESGINNSCAQYSWPLYQSVWGQQKAWVICLCPIEDNWTELRAKLRINRVEDTKHTVWCG